MTIYKPKTVGEKKLGKKWDHPPDVLASDDFLLLTKNEVGQSEESLQSTANVKILRNNGNLFERRFMKFCTVAAILIVFAFAACTGYYARQRLHKYKPFVNTIHVQFHEYRRHIDQDDQPESRIEGGFFEQVEIDWKMNRYEKLHIPPFIDVKRATVVNDFVSNWTAIVDVDNSRCFLLPLNRTITYSPDRFMEYIDKMQAGHALPNVLVERQLHKVITPPLEVLREFGNVISFECNYYETYKLARAEEPIAMSKRFACKFSGDIYSLGATGYPLLALVALEGCV